MQIEKRSIDWVPLEERHGKPSSLFTIWFAANMHLTTLVTGALCVTFGLNLFWSLVAIIVGNGLGALFMATHSAQGPKLGIPQMIQSRAQFGIIGAVIPLFIVIFMYIGFYASSGLLGGLTLGSALNINVTWGILIMNAVVFVITLFGHDVIHKMQKYLTWVFFAIYIITTVLVFRMPVPAGSWSVSGFNLPMFLLAIAVCACWPLTFAAYVADYSRYLPEDTSMKQTFWYTYLGTVGATIWMMLLGIILTASIPGYLDNAGGNLANLFGKGAMILFIIIVLGQISINVMNLYGAFMASTTTVEPFLNLKVTPKVRVMFLLGITIIGTLIELVGQASFVSLFTNFILFVMYFLIPWTAINLVDFYLLRKGRYNMKDIFDVNGMYGKVNWAAAFCYIVAVIAQIPFISSTFYLGPVAKMWQGADVAWVIGLIVPAVLYYYLMKPKMPMEMAKLDAMENSTDQAM